MYYHKYIYKLNILVKSNQFDNIGKEICISKEIIGNHIGGCDNKFDQIEE